MKVIRIAFVFLAAFCICVGAFAQLSRAPASNARTAWAQMAELTSTTTYGFLNGTAVAISGNVVVVGGQYGQQASVYVMPSAGWGNMIQTATLIASDEQACGLFGASVAISGNTIVVGDPEDNPSCGITQPGAAYVFVEPAGGWAGTLTETAKLTGSDALAAAAVGASISMDGDAVVAGAPGTFFPTDNGAAYVFVKPASGWSSMTQTAELTASDGTAGVQFGYSVGLSGTTIAVGSPYIPTGNNNSGAAYVFVRPSAGWGNATETGKLTAFDPLHHSDVGISVAVSGNTVVAGAFADVSANQAQGAAYVFVKPLAGWTNTGQIAKLTASNGNASDLLGSSVAIDGGAVVAGAPFYSRSTNRLTSQFLDEGAAYIFVEPTNGWANMTQTAQLNGSDARRVSQFGTCVAVSGHTVVTALPEGRLSSGRGYVFSAFTPQ